VAGDFNKMELSMSIDIPQRNQLVVDKYLQYANGRQAIVFGVDIEHAEHLAEIFKLNGISALSVHSELDDITRKRINSDFKNKRLMVLTNVELLTEGWDYFDVGAVLMARPTQSLAMYMQMLGRGTRLKSIEFIETEFEISIYEDAVSKGLDFEKMIYRTKGCTFFKHHSSDLFNETEQAFILKYYHKANCKILDFVDNSGKHALINTWELDKNKDVTKKVFITEENRQDQILKFKEKQEHKIKSKIKEDSTVDLLALPKLRIYHHGRMLELATEPQLNWLKAEGVWQEGVEYTKGQASEFITNFQAKDWQIEKLRKWGYDVSNGATVGQYSTIRQEKEGIPAR
jgi:superfamily II DNA or RNA helicase